MTTGSASELGTIYVHENSITGPLIKTIPVSALSWSSPFSEYPNGTYTIVLFERDYAGNTGGATTLTITVATPPPAPSSFYGARISSTQINLYWGASAGAINYEGHACDTSGTCTADTLLGNITSLSLPGLASGVSYTFYIRAIDASGVTSSYATTFVP
jgi:predicted phage tail protein